MAPFADAVGSIYIENAHKPSVKNYQEACRRMGIKEEQAVFVGDQLFTDVYGAKPVSYTHLIDTETELLIQDSMEKMKNIGTMLIVAHRLSTIQHADEIIVLSHGKIVEHGTHQELLAAQGRYYQLYTLQYHREQSEKQRGRK